MPLIPTLRKQILQPGLLRHTCFCRGPGLNSQHPRGGSQPPVPRDLLPSSDFYEHNMRMRYIDVHADKTFIHEINLFDKPSR